ncbi:MAG: methionyl-tRNA formyltransferase [Phycisphaerae bacterium]|jgi:methionyl-tRNA formyltransferase
MNVALMGSVSSSYYCLDALIRGGVEITAVLGLDDSRAHVVSDFRSLRPVAEEAGLPFLSFVKVSEPEVEAFLTEGPPDLLWVIGLSQLVPDRLIRIARHGGVGFHPTLLPEGRGRAPVAWTILRGARAAVNLFYLTDEPDAGDIIVQREVPVLPNDYSEDLIQRMNEVLTEVVLELAPLIRSGTLPRTPQEHSQASFYPKRTPADGLIDWSETTDAIYRLVRAAGRPYPGAFSYWESRKVTIWRAEPVGSKGSSKGESDAPPGAVLEIEPAGRILVKTRDGALWLTETAFEDGPEPTFATSVAVGDRLTSEPRGKES